jgi:carboxypeptidase Taq
VKKYLGLEVRKDAEGLLQDIHWSHGSIGYFPTYSLGSFYAAQMLDAAKSQIPGLEKAHAQGDFSQLKQWLNTNVHAWGKQFSADDLCKMATGKGLDVSHFIAYAKKKYGEVYQITMS